MGDESEGKNLATALDKTAKRYGLRRFVARNRGLGVAYRVAVAILGFAIIVTGLALIPLPGPGWLIVFAGLAVLSTEFAWAFDYSSTFGAEGVRTYAMFGCTAERPR